MQGLTDRQDEILRILAHHERVTVAELTRRLSVSEVTIRKELSVLADEGRLVRTHGGARLAEEPTALGNVHRRRGRNTEAKRALARRAREMVREGDTIFLDSGTTVAELATLVAEMDLRVVTNSLDVILALADGLPRVHCVGGTHRREAASFIGPAAVRSLREVYIDRAFLGTSGIAADGSCSAWNALESEVKRAAIERARSVVVMADAEKIGRTAFSVFAESRDVSIYLLEDDEPARSFRDSGDREVILVPR